MIPVKRPHALEAQGYLGRPGQAPRPRVPLPHEDEDRPTSTWFYAAFILLGLWGLGGLAGLGYALYVWVLWARG